MKTRLSRLLPLLLLAAAVAALVLAATRWQGYTPASAANVVDIAGGQNHTCALTGAGGARCWGHNELGQLGIGTTDSSPHSTPLDVSGLSSGVTSIAAKSNSSCVVHNDTAKCWGNNGFGQLGNGAENDGIHPAPQDVCASGSEAGADCVPLTGVQKVVTADRHGCALMDTGGLKCWGDNFFGQLGNSSNTDSFNPVNVTGLTAGVADVAADSLHTCALTTGGGIKCWGYGGNGHLGTGSVSDRNSPGDAVGLTSGVAAIDVGQNHSCAVTTGGGAKCWGSNNQGQLGITSVDNNPHATPLDVSGLTSGVADITGGLQHTCAITTGDVAKCWGDNGSGHVGDGTFTDRSSPVNTCVTGLVATGNCVPFSDVARLDAAFLHSCGITNSGNAKCWGVNSFGQVGDGSISTRSRPTNVSDLSAKPTSTPASTATHTLTNTPTGTPTETPTPTATLTPTNTPANTATHTPTNSPTNTPKNTPTGACPDYDGDTVCDDVDLDDDNDGCDDTAEQQKAPLSELTGGRRDYHWFWDFFDAPTGMWPAVSRDKAVSGLDFFAVLSRFGTSDGGGVAPINRNTDPLSLPPEIGYHPAFDRGPSSGPNAWNLTAANGSVAGTDFFALLVQFGHSCA